MERRRRALLWCGLALAGVLAALAAGARRAAGIPFSPLTAGRRVGAGYAARRGVEGPPLDGEMDDMETYARPGFDPEAVHPQVRRFYEATAEFEMRYRVRWHRGFRLGAALAARLTSRIEQLNLPARGGEWRAMESSLTALPAAADPREGARLWVRTDAASGDAVFVAAYASHVAGGERFTNIAVPLPGCNLSTVLRLDNVGRGVEHTTLADSSAVGLFAVVPPLAVALPMDQRFRVWPADADDPAPDVPGDPALVATHEMWVCGRQFLTVEYAIQTRTSTS